MSFTEQCRLRHAKIHLPLCRLLSRKAFEIAEAARVTVSRVRLLILCVGALAAESASNVNVLLGENAGNDLARSSRTTSGETSAEASAEAPTTVEAKTYKASSLCHTASYADTLTMASNEALFSEEHISTFSTAARCIWERLPSHYRVLSVSELVRLACLTDTNAFGITLLKPGSQWRDVLSTSRTTSAAAPPKIVDVFVAGYGIYPKCAQLNHSCYPSCHVAAGSSIGAGGNRCEKRLIPQNDQPLLNGPILQMRTIRPVSCGEELTDSYIDLHLDRWTRRKELLKTKHFLCCCDRCKEPLESSSDRFLSGIVCPQCAERDGPKNASKSPTSRPVVKQWSEILHSVATWLLQQNSSPLSSLPEDIKWIILDAILPDFPNLVPLWTVLQRPSRTALSFVHDALHIANMSSDQRFLYDGSAVPVLLPLDDLTVSEEAEKTLLRWGTPPLATRCERCGNDVDPDEVRTKMGNASLLWEWVTETLQQGNSEDRKRALALFLRQVTPAVLHPFHAWVYRASQYLVDDDYDNLIVACEQTDAHTEDVLEHVVWPLLSYVVLLRHQLACQLMALPAFHDEVCLTFRVLVYILTRVDNMLERHSEAVVTHHHNPAHPQAHLRERVRKARSSCSQEYAVLCTVLYAA